MNTHLFPFSSAPRKLTRRDFLGQTAGALAAGCLCPRTGLLAAEAAALKPAAKLRYRIAVCDWMILKRQRLRAFQLTKDIGANTAYLKSIFQTP